MVFEIAEIRVVAGQEAEFEAAVQRAVPLFQRARGCHSMALERSVELPGKYRLVIEWETLEDHVVHFRGSPDFLEWRRLVGGHFDGPPVVEHTATVLRGF
jgi:heme-degrading monooxygenase HmoA